MQLVKFMVLILFLMASLGCTGISKSIPILNQELNDQAITDDSMTKLKAQGCGPEQLVLTKIVTIADQQYAEYICTTTAGTKVRIYKMNDKFFIISED